MLKINDKNVVVAKLQARSDKHGNPRALYIVNSYEGELLRIFDDNEENLQELKKILPDFSKPTFVMNVEVMELKKYLHQSKFLSKEL